MDILAAHQTSARLAAFAGTLIVMASAEALWPKRARTQRRNQRWTTNAAIIALGALAARALSMAPAPLAAGVAAIWAAQANFGVLHWLHAPAPGAIVATLLAFDAAVWAQHVAFHRIAWLWPLHAVHHADRDIDATTALRFHPLEILLSTLFKAAIAALIGAPLAAVIGFEIVLNACALFNHANLRLPAPLDRVVRLVIVTPDMHRVHHSVRPEELNTNFGFCLSWWDRVFGVYRAQPRDGHDAMTIGLSAYQSDAPSRLWWSLVLPWRLRR